jgi:hypothetical protein
MNSACGWADRIISLVDLPVGEIAPALVVLGFETHRGPHVGGHQIGAARGVHRIGELFEVAGAIQPGASGFDLVARRRRHLHLEIEHFGGLQPGVADVVRIADPGDRLALNRAAMLDEGENVGEIWQG